MSALELARAHRIVPRLPRGLGLIAGLACVGIGAVTVPLAAALADRQSVAVILAFCVACAVPFVVGYRRGIDIGEPIYVVAVWYLLAFPLRAAFIGTFPRDASYLGTFNYLGYIRPALMLSLIAFLCVLAGYYLPLAWGVAKRMPRMDAEFAQQPLLGRAALVTVVGVVAWAYLLFVVHRVHGLDDSFNYSDAEGLVVQVSSFLAYGVALVGILVFGRVRQLRPIHFVVLALVMTPTVFVCITFARRYVLITAVTSLVLAFHYRRRKVSFRSVALVAALLLCVVFPLIQGLRVGGAVAVQSSGTGSALARAGQSATDLFGRGVTSYRHLAADVVMNRMNGVDTLAGVMEATPARIPYLGGREYYMAPAMALVPRALWPGKPRDRFNQDFAPQYFGGTNYQTHVITFNTADLYLHFGVAGVVIGSLLIGVLYRLVHAYFVGGRRRASECACFVYTFVFIYIVAVEWGLATIAVSLLKTVPVLLLIAWFMRVTTKGPAGHDSHA